MGVFRHFPYTNFHELNMDEILDILKTMSEEWDATKAQWATYKDFIDNYFATLDVTDEVLAAIRTLASTGELNTVIDPVIASEVTAWLEHHISETTPVIDDTLTVEGAGADAKITGNGIFDINNELYNLIESINVLDNDKWISGAFFNANGTLSQDVRFSYQYLRVPTAGQWYTYRQSAFGSNKGTIPVFDIDHNYIKTLTGVAYDQSNAGNYIFTITEEDIKSGARYLGMSRQSTAMIPFALGRQVNGTHMPRPQWAVDRVKTLLWGRVLVCDGDSIAYGNQDLPDGYGAWWRRLTEQNNMSGKNYSINGAVITDGLTFQSGDPRHCICTDIDTIYNEYENADYIILEGGTNDADLIGSITSGNIPEKFGSWNDADFNSAHFDITTFCGAVDMLFYKAVTYYAGKKIGFIIPPQMGTSYSAQKNRRAYFDELIKIAAKWHIPVLDLWKESTIDARVVADYDPSMTATQNINNGKFYADGQHLTSAGYNLIQNKIQSWAASL